MSFLERIVGKVELDGSGFVAGAKRVESAASSMSKRVGANLKGMLVGAFGVTAIEEGIRRTVQWGGAMSDLAKRAGVTAEELQKGAYAVGQNGASQEELVAFWERVRRARTEALSGDKSKLESFGAFGIGAEDLMTKSTAELGLKIADKIQTGDIDKLENALVDVGGKGAVQLKATFKSGMSGLMEEAEKIGAIVSNEDVELLDAAGDKWDQLVVRIRARLIPALTGLLDTFVGLEDTARKVGAVLGGLVAGLNAGKLKDAAVPSGDTKAGTALNWWSQGGVRGSLLRLSKEVAAQAGTALPMAQNALSNENASIAKRKADELARKAEEENSKEAAAFAQNTADRDERIKKINAQILDIQTQAYEKTLSAGQKRVFLASKIREIEAQIAKESDPEKLANLNLQREKLKAEQAGITSNGVANAQTDNLAKIGGFVGGAENQLAAVAREQLTELRGINQGVKALNRMPSSDGGSLIG